MSCRIASLGFPKLNASSNFDVAALLVGFPASCHAATDAFLASFGGRGLRRGDSRHDARCFPASFIVATLGLCSQKRNFE